MEKIKRRNQSRKREDVICARTESKRRDRERNKDLELKIMLLQHRMKISTGIGFLRSPELAVLSALSDVRSEAKLDRLIWLDWRFTRCVGLTDPELGA